MSPSPRQIRAARALLDMTQADLAERAGLALSTVRMIERGAPTPSEERRGAAIDPDHLTQMRVALEAAGVELLSLGAVVGSPGGEGVRLRASVRGRSVRRR